MLVVVVVPVVAPVAVPLRFRLWLRLWFRLWFQLRLFFVTRILFLCHSTVGFTVSFSTGSFSNSGAVGFTGCSGTFGSTL